MLTEMVGSSCEAKMNGDYVYKSGKEENVHSNGAVTFMKSGADVDQEESAHVTLTSGNGVVNGHVKSAVEERTRNDSVCDDNTAMLNIKDLLKKRDCPVIEDDMRCPIELLPGENLIHLGSGAFSGSVMLTTYRLFITYSQSFVNIPLRLIESVDIHDIAGVMVVCKDGTVHNFTLPNSEKCFKWLHEIKQELNHQTFTEYFALSFAIMSRNDDSGPWDLSKHKDGGYKLGAELARLGFNLKTTWRITTINEQYRHCRSYPKENIVPKDFDDSMLEKAASFRTLGRFPTAVWRHENGAVLLRASQPVVGVFCQRNTDDENLIQAIMKACGCGDRMLIVDARSYTAAVANRARGGGCEYSEFYKNCDIEFMNLPNIHAIRASFSQLRTLISNNTDNASWYAALDSSKWMFNLSNLLSVSKHVAETLTRQAVLVHCSDGWDRTPQIVSLAQIILDPHYRTFEGFQVLIEKDWLMYGHKFSDRCGQKGSNADPNEVSPVFLQWLDAVHQLTKQFPTAFEFDEAYLMKLLQHTYSCMFGTFLFNNEKERQDQELSCDLASIWSLLNTLKPQLYNRLYNPGAHKILYVNTHPSELVLWTSVYSAQASYTSNDTIATQEETTGLQRSQSYSDLSKSTESNLHLLSRSPRRLSDPDIPNNSSYTSLTDSCNFTGSGTIAQPTTNSSILSTSMTGSNANVVTNGAVGTDTETEEADERTDSKNVRSNSSKEELQYKKYLDIDGLTINASPARQRLDDIVGAFERQISELKKTIADLQSRPPPSPGPSCCTGHHAPEYQILGDCGPSSAGSNSSHQSDSSWETLSSKEAGLTLWIPDHAVSFCSSCNVPFKIFRRKHHCRQCGQVFCQSCADVFVPLPEQQLYQPVRVCTSCHKARENKDDEADLLAENLSKVHLGTNQTNAAGDSAKTARLRSDSDISDCDVVVPHQHSKPIPVKGPPSSRVKDESMSWQYNNTPSPKLNQELSSSQISLHSNGSLVFDSRNCQKTCSQESINMDSNADGKRMLGARAEC